jgi:putative intracellular protease/amidase
MASPKGGKAPLDPSSVEAFSKDESSVNFLNHHKSLWENTQPLSNFAGKASDFDAIFFPGGHGPMFDLADDKVSQELTADFWEQGKVVAAVCHGPAALVNVKLGNGEWLLKGKRVSAFTNSEEEAMDMAKVMPFELETEIKNRTGAGGFEKEVDFKEKVVVDGKLITGQNPASALGVGKAIAEALGI